MIKLTPPADATSAPRAGKLATLTMRLEPELLQRIAAQASLEGRTASDVVRRLVDAHLP